jgi:hypothetical protein
MTSSEEMAAYTAGYVLGSEDPAFVLLPEIEVLSTVGLGTFDSVDLLRSAVAWLNDHSASIRVAMDLGGVVAEFSFETMETPLSIAHDVLKLAPFAMGAVTRADREGLSRAVKRAGFKSNALDALETAGEEWVRLNCNFTPQQAQEIAAKSMAQIEALLHGPGRDHLTRAATAPEDSPGQRAAATAALEQLEKAVGKLD